MAQYISSGSGRNFRPELFSSSGRIRFRPELKKLVPVHPYNKLEARVLSEYKRSLAAPSTFCTLIKHYFSFIKHYIQCILYSRFLLFCVLQKRRRHPGRNSTKQSLNCMTGCPSLKTLSRIKELCLVMLTRCRDSLTNRNR